MKRTTPGGLGVARRYARALLEVAVERKEETKVAEELQTIAETLGGNEELLSVLTNPSVPLAKRKAVARAVFAGCHDVLARLVDLLLERDRLSLLPELDEAYRQLWNEHRGVLLAEAVSAVPLDAAEVAALEAALESVVSKSVELDTIVDRDVLGGVLVRVAGKTYDGTVRTRLQLLRERLIQGRESA